MPCIYDINEHSIDFHDGNGEFRGYTFKVDASKTYNLECTFSPGANEKEFILAGRGSTIAGKWSRLRSWINKKVEHSHGVKFASGDELFICAQLKYTPPDPSAPWNKANPADHTPDADRVDFSFTGVGTFTIYVV